MAIFNTSELKKFIESLYIELKLTAIEDGVFIQLNESWGKGTPTGRDGAFCYSDETGYHYGVNERGKVIKHTTTQSLTEIVYLVLSSEILQMASAYECRNRISGQDFRRLMFQKELEYGGILGDKYQQFAKQKISETLAIAPFSD